MEPDELSLELQMHAFRLMRSEQYRSQAEIRKALLEDFPEAAPEQIDLALRSLANRLARTY